MTRKVNAAGSPRVLMLGYNGANNTGAEALLLSDIEDVRAVLGPEARITVPTLNEANLRRYLAESATLRIAPMPTLYFAAIRRLVAESDLVLLVEGSHLHGHLGQPAALGLPLGDPLRRADGQALPGLRGGRRHPPAGQRRAWCAGSPAAPG